MELVYLWVEEYKNIHKQGFNFSPKFNCHYDEDSNELIIDENDDYIENFFGDNINVTAIVGKNGSGKSSVAEMILLKIPKEKHKKYILVGCSKKDGKEKYHSWSNVKDFRFIGIDSITESDVELLASGVEIGTKDNRDFSHNLVYLNGQELNFRVFDEVKYSDADNNIFVPKYIYQYNNNLHRFKSKNFFYEFDKIRFYIRILKEDEIIQDIEKIDNLDKKLKEKVKSYISSLDSKEFFCRNFLMAFVRYSLLNLDKEKYEKFIENVENINNCFEIKVEEFEFILNINDIVESLKFLEILEFKNETTNRNHDTKYYYEVEIDNKNINTLWIFEYILNLSGLKKKNLPILELDLYDSNKKLLYAELSQGEKQYIRLLIEIISNKSAGDLSEMIEPTVYIFDEIETSLHPQWQKKIFNDIVKIFNDWRDKKAHLIFLTHSPFLLSDIPKQNIIFLDTYNKEDTEVKEEKQKVGNCRVVPHDEVMHKKQTFGANIHTLLSDSFFMDDGLMGEFAKGKIDKIIKYLREDKIPEPREAWVDSKENLKKIIEAIGEPFLQHKVLELYYDKFTDDATKKERKKELEKQKKQIESELSKYD